MFIPLLTVFDYLCIWLDRCSYSTICCLGLCMGKMVTCVMDDRGMASKYLSEIKVSAVVTS